MTDSTGSETLRALVERIVPADDYASGWQAGVGDFLRRIVERDLADRAAVLSAGLDLLDAEARARYDDTPFAGLPHAAQDTVITDLLADDCVQHWEPVPANEFLRMMIDLTVQGYYGDPANGGNRDAVSWDMIGYRAMPDHATWPRHDRAPAPTIAWPDAADHYDAVVVGAGAGGGVAACVLAEAGLRVLLIERGRWLSPGDLRPDHLRSHRLPLGYRSTVEPPAAWNPRVFAGADGETVVWPTDPHWHNNAMMIGGGTRVFGAQAWRFCPEDFRMASTYGVPDGSSLADWPISHDDLEPDYDRAEWELGVSGDAAGNAYAGPRRRSYPMPPLPPNGTAAPLREGAAILGLGTSPVPLLINSRPYNGRGACLQCGACVGFGCPGEFKTGTANTAIPRAVATGRCDVLTETQAERVITDADGRATGVALVAAVDGETIRRDITADRILLAAGAIETARLLLNSPSGREPHGLGNNHDLVGRNLQGHVYAGAMAVFDQPVQDCVGPGPSIATNDYRHHNDGVVGGAMIANDFVPMPLFVYRFGSMLGHDPELGRREQGGDAAPLLAAGPGDGTGARGTEPRVPGDPRSRRPRPLRDAGGPAQRRPAPGGPQDGRLRLRPSRRVGRGERSNPHRSPGARARRRPQRRTAPGRDVPDGHRSGDVGHRPLGTRLGTRQSAHRRRIAARHQRWSQPRPDHPGPRLPGQPASGSGRGTLTRSPGAKLRLRAGRSLIRRATMTAKPNSPISSAAHHPTRIAIETGTGLPGHRLGGISASTRAGSALPSTPRV